MTQDDHTPRTIRLPTRDPRFAVGKRMPSATYVHRSVLDTLPEEALGAAFKMIPPDFEFDLVKLFRHEDKVAVYSCSEFDEAHEPAQGPGLSIAHDGRVTKFAPPADPWIYHHKWLMVREDYQGFNVAEATRRSHDILRVLGELRARDPAISSRIGRQAFWAQHVAPLLN